MEYKEGDRVLLEMNGVQFAGTVGDGDVTSDIDGADWGKRFITRKLTGVEAAKVGDIIVAEEGDEAKVLAIDNQHNVFLISSWSDFDLASEWYIFNQAKENGWELKDQEDILELSIDEVAKKFKVDASKLRIKKED